MLSAPQVRRRRIYGGISIAVGLTLMVVAVLAYFGKLGASSPDEVAANSSQGTATASPPASGTATATAAVTTTPPPAPTTTTPAIDPNIKAPLTVVNASDLSGLAGRGRDAFVGAGWEVAEIGNYTETVDASTIYYPEGDTNAAAAATNLQKQFPKLTKIAVSPLDFPYTGVVVVMSGDWDPGEG